MKVLRVVAILLGLSLIVAEAYRSWGTARPMPYWIEDPLCGALLIVSAMLVGKETIARRALFSGAWGVNAGALYGAFVSKLYQPEAAEPGNFDLSLLTVGRRRTHNRRGRARFKCRPSADERTYGGKSQMSSSTVVHRRAKARPARRISGAIVSSGCGSARQPSGA